MSEPGDLLITHRAPNDLFERSMSRRRPPERRPRWVAPAALAATFLLGFFAGGRGAPSEAPVTAVAASPEAPAELNPVRFVFHAPSAEQVGVAGSWNNWEPAVAMLRSDGAGVFYGVVALPPGQHEYMFVVDDADWVTDPMALVTVDDGFGRRNAVIEI